MREEETRQVPVKFFGMAILRTTGIPLSRPKTRIEKADPATDAGSPRGKILSKAISLAGRLRT
jgi:hypothetical protein